MSWARLHRASVAGPYRNFVKVKPTAYQYSFKGTRVIDLIMFASHSDCSPLGGRDGIRGGKLLEISRVNNLICTNVFSLNSPSPFPLSVIYINVERYIHIHIKTNKNYYDFTFLMV